ncbi:MAG: PKD domain-containing protein [Flavobacteriales bacterium]
MSFSSSFSAHLVGGEMSYRCLGGNSYEITLTIYRDCQASTTQFDPRASVGIFNHTTGALIRTLSVQFPGESVLPINSVSSCLVVPPGLCLRQTTYKDTTTLLPSTGGYDLVYQRCCRGPGIVNITNPSSAGNTYYSFIPPNDTLCNSSPSFNNSPPVFMCINDSINFDYSATDPDGDSLVYEFVTPFIGGTNVNPLPAPSAPPFSTVNWAAGYTVNAQINGAPSLTLDAATGFLTGVPTSIGKYVVGVKVREYRNGVFLSETIRDFQFNILNCQKSVASIFDPGTICNSYTVNFANNSVNASTYFWNFGDPTTVADTSLAMSPSYTYPDTGIYRVVLIVDPNSPICADTSVLMVEVYPILKPFFSVPASECFEGHSFDFTAAGSYFNSTQIDWDFGANASIPTSSNLSETGITYAISGKKYISVRYRDYGCDTTFTDSLTVYPPLSAEFDVVQDTVCLGDSIPTRFSSTSNPALNFLWNFGDGNTSTEKSPSYLYLNPGSYSLSLIVSDANCADTLVKPTGLVVLPSPVARFTNFNAVVPTYSSEITFINNSENDFISIFTDGDGGVFNPFTQVTHTYLEEKLYYPTLYVENTLGCSDTLFGEIYVQPEIYVPNSFTPNGDDINEVFLPSVAASVNFDMMIFNRWGELIFRTTNPKQGWDGKGPEGQLLQQDAYVYRILYRDPSGLNKELFGNVNLLR